MVLDLESTGIFASKPDVIVQHKKYFKAFSDKGMNSQKLNFNQNLNVELQEISGYLCLGSLIPMEDTRTQNVLKCPLCSSISSREFNGKVC